MPDKSKQAIKKNIRNQIPSRCDGDKMRRGNMYSGIAKLRTRRLSNRNGKPAKMPSASGTAHNRDRKKQQDSSSDTSGRNTHGASCKPFLASKNPSFGKNPKPNVLGKPPRKLDSRFSMSKKTGRGSQRSMDPTHYNPYKQNKGGRKRKKQLWTTIAWNKTLPYPLL